MERAPLDPSRLTAGLEARWSRVTVVDETGSTNADLLADPTATDRVVLAAEFQTAGRGRLDRGWTSPPRAGLIFSVALRPAAPLGRWGWLPLLAGVAVVTAVTRAGLTTARLKWPNDVLVEGRKLAGILAQVRDGLVVVGCGLNVTTTAEELLPLVEAPALPATSLGLEGVEVDRTALLADVLTELDAQVARWDDVGGDAAACGLAAAYDTMCSTLGRTVTLTEHDGSTCAGQAVGIDPDGHLLLQVDGAVRTVAAGDVRHTRPLA